MANRLDPINLMSFVGGLNLRRNQFELADDESPDLLNVDIDPRGGFYTRKGWARWNYHDIVDVETTTWAPVNAWSHTLTNGTQFTYVVNGTTVWRGDVTGAFSALPGVVAEADPHGSDFTAWNNDVYLALGMAHQAVRVGETGTITTLAPETYSEYELPIHNTMPRCGYVTTHAGYVFVANTNESDGLHYTRVRWSHPDVPDAFNADDYVDIDAGGGKITGIMGFQDHLLIFKGLGLWALYGYDQDSWQLVQVSSKVGCPTITAMTRSENAAYFYSATDQGGIYAYQGQTPVYISEAIRPAFEAVTDFELVFVSWAGRRLWVAVPWLFGIGATTQPSTTLLFDPDTGKGAWTLYRSEMGSLGLVIDNSDVLGKYPMAVLWSTQTACLVLVDYIDGAYDALMESTILVTGDDSTIVTGLDQEISVTGAGYIGVPFDSYYKTRWLHGGWPDRKKSWRRPTFICRQVPAPVDLIVETYRDYNETNVHRTRTLQVRPQGTAMWTPGGADDVADKGFDWTPTGEDDPRGADWGPAQAGSRLVRAGSQGLARAVQMRVRASPNTPAQKWGVDGIVAKIVMRRFR